VRRFQSRACNNLNHFSETIKKIDICFLQVFFNAFKSGRGDSSTLLALDKARFIGILMRGIF
jgi:hypothetical protein